MAGKETGPNARKKEFLIIYERGWLFFEGEEG
jgi:hypothetical protein